MENSSGQIPPFPADMDRDAFGYWLSGFTDGEGNFALNIHRHKRPGKTYEVPGGRFEIVLRGDDSDVLDLIRSFWGVGHVGDKKADAKQGSNPARRFYVTSAGDLADVVVPHFDRYPLVAKKRRDFAVWKRGVELLYRVSSRSTRGIAGGTAPKWTDGERAGFGEILATLRIQRIFVASARPPREPKKPGRPAGSMKTGSLFSSEL